MGTNIISISVRGRSVDVPCVAIRDRLVVVTGRWIKVARVKGEDWLPDEAVPNPPEFLHALRSERTSADVFTFAQRFNDPQPRHAYHSEENNLAVLPITTFSAWWQELSQDTRRNVRKAEKMGVTIKASELHDDFAAGIKSIYDETPVRQGRKFWHYGKDLVSVKRENSAYSEKSEFLGAYVGAEMIGFLKMVYLADAAQIMQILSKNAEFDKRPSNALIAHAVKLCAEKNLKYLTYSHYSYGNKTSSQLAEFKRRNGFLEMRFPRYYVPLTWKGALALRCGFHRGLAGVFPAWCINRLLELRARYYARALVNERGNVGSNKSVLVS